MRQVYCKMCYKETNNPKFCSLSCAAIYNNKIYPKKREDLDAHKKDCKTCNNAFYCKNKGIKYCSKKCRREGLSEVGSRTKENLFSTRSNWQSARTTIRKDADRVFEGTGKDKICTICGYSKHIEICHIRAVKDFPGTSMLKEINDPSNLTALCPNHHWELDNGMLQSIAG